MNKSPEWLVLALLIAPVAAACFVSCAIAFNLQNIGPDGWKRLYALNKALVNFYVTVFITAIIGARYVEVLGDQIFIALLVASAAVLGIKIRADMTKEEKD